MKPHWLSLLALATIMLIMTSEAQPSTNLAAPAELVVTVGHPKNYQVVAGDALEYDVYVNWTRSSADSGSDTYNVCRIDTNGVFVACANNTPPTDIPNRPGWVTFHDTGSINPGTDPFNSFWLYNVSLNQTTFNGLSTAPVAVRLNATGDHNQTGNVTLNASNVVSLKIQRTSTTTQSGLAYFNFTHSSGDPNASTTGDFDYWVFEQFATRGSTAPPCRRYEYFLGICPPATAGGLTSIWSKSSSGAGTNGNRSFTVEWAGTSPFILSLDVTPVDNATGLWGTQSCTTVVDTDVITSGNACGVFTNSTGSRIIPNLPAAPTPSFPGLDVAAFTSATGLDALGAGYILGALLILLVVIVGWVVARGAGASIAAGLALVWTYRLGLVEAWLVIVIFALSVLVVVFVGLNPGKG